MCEYSIAASVLLYFRWRNTQIDENHCKCSKKYRNQFIWSIYFTFSCVIVLFYCMNFRKQAILCFIAPPNHANSFSILHSIQITENFHETLNIFHPIYFNYNFLSLILNCYRPLSLWIQALKQQKKRNIEYSSTFCLTCIERKTGDFCG